MNEVKLHAVSLIVAMMVLSLPNTVHPGWLYPDTPAEKMEKAKQERDECLAKAAKEAKSDLGFRQLGSQCYSRFNAKFNEIIEAEVQEVFSKQNANK